MGITREAKATHSAQPKTFPDRRELVIIEKSRIHNFKTGLTTAKESALTVLPAVKAGTPLALKAWHKNLHDFHKNRSYANRNALLAVTKTAAANLIATTPNTNSQSEDFRFQLYVESQHEFTRALIALHKRDRELLLRCRDGLLFRAMFGALSVARLATALHEQGVTCYMPTTEEDRYDNIDLICSIKGTGACLQVKTASKLSEDGREMSSMGTERFNDRYSLSFLPLAVAVPPLRPLAMLRDQRFDDIATHIVRTIT